MSAPAIGRRQFNPPVTARVNWDDPLAARLVACHLPTPNGAVDLAGFTPLAKSGAPFVADRKWGRGIKSAAGNDGASVTIGTAHKLSLQPPITFAWVGQSETAPTNLGTLIGANYDASNGSPFLCWAVFVQDSGGQKWTLAWNSAGTFSTAMASIAWAAGPHVIVGILESGSTRLWVDGVLGVTGAGVSTINYGSASNYGFNVDGPAARDQKAVHNLGCVWNRGLTVAEVAAFTANPHRFLRW